jgi:TolB-like protein/Flp pilus assembly protein TadD
MADDVRALLVYCGGEQPAVVPHVRAPARSLAVLPFLAIGPDADDFAEGLTEDVIAQLSTIRALRVIARASVSPFRTREQPPRDIGARLGVRALLDGSIRRAGTRVRIVAQLIDAPTESPLWSHTYDRELTDMFGVQAEVADEIARALEAELTSGERARLHRKATGNVAAYQLYLKGRHCLLKYTADGVRQSFAFLEQALAVDSHFALAHAWMALAHVISGPGYGGPAVDSRESYRLARAAAEQALAIDPDLGEAHGALGFVQLVLDFDWTGSERAFRRALELTPGSDLMWSAYGLLLSALERYDEAIAAYRRAQQLDPLTAVHSSTLAAMLIRAGRLDEALEESRRLIDLQPDFPMARSTLGWALLKRGQADAGLAEMERAVALAPGNTMLLGQLGHAYAVAGRTEDARRILERFGELAGTRKVSSYHLAYVHAGLGEQEAAIDCLEQAYEERAGGIYAVTGSFLFIELAPHPRFVALLRRMNLRDRTSAGGHDG